MNVFYQNKALSNPPPLLSVRDVSVAFGPALTVESVCLDIAKGQTLALVGESGSGKTTVGLATLGLLPPSARIKGSICFEGTEVIGAKERDLRRIRGQRVGMIFQEPLSALNPLHSIEKQIGEVLTLHCGLSGAARKARILELLDMVELEGVKGRLHALPHTLSGGQRQRVMIAMALAAGPDLLIADEPTTALDVTIQAQIVSLLQDLRARLGMAMLLITHDLRIVERLAERVAVMQNGRIVEAGTTKDVLYAPCHAYTQTLLAARNLGRAALHTIQSGDKPLLEATGVCVRFARQKTLLGRVKSWTLAVASADVRVYAGQTLGIVGESGSGKTTLGLALLRLNRATAGEVAFAGVHLPLHPPKAFRAGAQIVFQDPYGALSPRMSVGGIIAEGLKVHNPHLSAKEREERVIKALEDVEMDPALRHRYPHAFSGGQRQRIAIARALVLAPRLLVLDEPTSALDVSVQARIIALLRRLQAQKGLSYIFISHDLGVIKAMAHHIAVMQNGVIVEHGPASEILDHPQHPYTQTLMAAA